MEVFRIIDDYPSIIKGVTNRDYRITGRKNFWIQPGERHTIRIPLILNRNSVKRTGTRGKLRFIEIHIAELIKYGNFPVLDATRNTEEGAIVFWDLWHICGIDFPEVKTRKAKIVLKNIGKASTTLLCVIYPKGMIEAKYHLSKQLKLKFESRNLKIEMAKNTQ